MTHTADENDAAAAICYVSRKRAARGCPGARGFGRGARVFESSRVFEEIGALAAIARSAERDHRAARMEARATLEKRSLRAAGRTDLTAVLG